MFGWRKKQKEQPKEQEVKEVKEATKIEVKPGNFGTARSFTKDPTYKGTPVLVRIIKRKKIEVRTVG